MISTSFARLCTRLHIGLPIGLVLAGSLIPSTVLAFETSTATLTETHTATVTGTPSAGPRPDDLSPRLDVEPPTETATAAVANGYGPGLRTIETVSVHGRRVNLGRIAGSAHTLGAEVLENFEYDDAQRALLRVPGVYIRDEDGFGLRPNIGLRGASSDRSAKVTLMEDGVLLAPAPYAAPPAYYFPLTTRMAEIEVFKGPAAVRHGPNTVGGAINLVTEAVPDQGTRAMIDLAVGQFGYGKGHGRVGWGNENFGVLLEGARIQSTGFKELDGGGDTGFAKNEAMLKLRYNTDPSADIVHRFDAKVGYATEVSNETYVGLSDEDFRLNGFRRYRASRLGRMDWDRSQVQLGYTLDAGYSFHLSVTAYRNDFSRAWLKVNRFEAGPSIYDIFLDPTGLNAIYVGILRGELDSSELDNPINDGSLRIGTNDRQFVAQGVQVSGEWKEDFSADVSNRLTFGARFHYDRVRRDHTESSFDMVRGALVPVPNSELETILANQGEATTGAFFLQNELTLFEDLFITPGVRVELIQTSLTNRLVSPQTTQDNGYSVIIPGFGIYYQATRHLGLLAGVHQGFSPVAPGQPEEVVSEKSINYEVGGRYSGRGLRAELIGYFNDYSNISGTCTFSTGCRDDQQNLQFNGGAAWVYGVEASTGVSQNLTDDILLTLDATYTLTVSEFRTSFISENPLFGDVEEGDRLPYLPQHQANVSLGFNLGALGVFASYTLVDRMFDEAGTAESVPDNQKTDVQHIVDATVRYDFSSDNHVYARIDNLLNQAYIASRRPLGARPGKPFQFQLGYTHRFGD